MSMNPGVTSPAGSVVELVPEGAGVGCPTESDGAVPITGVPVGTSDAVEPAGRPVAPAEELQAASENVSRTPTASRRWERGARIDAVMVSTPVRGRPRQQCAEDTLSRRTSGNGGSVPARHVRPRSGRSGPVNEPYGALKYVNTRVIRSAFWAAVPNASNGKARKTTL